MEQDKVQNLDAFISQYMAQLRIEGAAGLVQYEQDLRNNASYVPVFNDLLFEGRAALMLLRNGFDVTFRETPDLQLELGGATVYAEVKHFRQKEQDRIDEMAMLEATDLLVPIGDTAQSEGIPAWKQIANVAVKKAEQYMSGAPNILIVESSSDSLEWMLGTAAHEYDEEVLRTNDQRLRRLNAFMLVNTRLIGFKSSGPLNVEFCQTAHAAVPMNARLVSSLRAIRQG